MLYDSNGRFTISLVNSQYGKFTFAFVISRPGFQEPSVRKNTIAIIKHNEQSNMKNKRIMITLIIIRTVHSNTNNKTQ